MRDKVVYGWFDNNKIFYVGLGTRNRANLRCRRNPYCTNKRVKAERNNTFEIRILFSNLTLEEACQKEIELIDLYGRLDLETGCLTNMTNGGEGTTGLIAWNKGIPRTEQTKEKISKANSGENSYHFGKTGSNSVRYGATHSQGTKDQMSKSRMKKVTTPLGTFNSCKEAASAHGIDKSYMSRKVRNPKHSEYFYTE